MVQILEAVQQEADSRIPFADLARQNAAIRDELEAAVKHVVHGASFVLGEAVESFESAFAAYCQADFAVGCNSGTSAVHMALRAIGTGPGDEVITVSSTFVGTVWGILYCGATPVFVDIEADTMIMDVQQIEAQITPRTKAILPVHLYGHPVDMEPLMELAARHGLYVIEDAAQAHGARYRGRRAGSLGHMACFSFYPGKNLGAWGEGGAVVTSDPDLHRRLRSLRDHGQSQRYCHDELGFNYRMDGIQGAVLAVKLPYLERWNAARRAVAGHYHRLLSDVDGITVPTVRPWAESAHHLYVIRLSGRDEIHRKMQAQGISCGLHYPVPVHRQPALAGTAARHAGLPVTTQAAGQVLSLPLYPELENAAVERVAETLKYLLGERTL